MHSTFVATNLGNGRREYGFRDPLLDKSTREMFFMPLVEKSDKYIENLTNVGAALVRGIGNIPGVDNIAVGLYHLNIGIGSAFSWDGDVGPKVDYAIAEVQKQMNSTTPQQ
jgi:hypothetical protein